MLRKIKIIVQTDLIRTSFFTSLSTFVRIVAAFVSNKVLAVYVGPVGIALLGQFSNFFRIVTAIATGGINNGVLRNIAKYRSNETETQKTISTGFRITIFSSVITAFIVLVFADYFSIILFKTTEYKFIIILLAVSLTFISLNSFLLSVLNGRKELMKYTWINIGSSVLTLGLSLALVAKFKVRGVLFSLVISQTFVFIIASIITIKSYSFKIKWLFQSFDKIVAKTFSQYSAMALVASFAAPLSLMIVRNYIGENLSWQAAGYWQGVWTISEVYLLFITSTLSVYYLPRLSEITNHTELRKEIFHTSKIILPIISIVAFLIFLFKEPLMHLLFTREFTPMLPLFKYQLAGDVIKIASWLVAAQMVSKTMTRLFILSEIIFSSSFVLLAIIFVRNFGLQGAAFAFAVNYFLYFIFMLFAFRRSLFTVSDEG